MCTLPSSNNHPRFLEPTESPEPRRIRIHLLRKARLPRFLQAQLPIEIQIKPIAIQKLPLEHGTALHPQFLRLPLISIDILTRLQHLALNRSNTLQFKIRSQSRPTVSHALWLGLIGDVEYLPAACFGRVQRGPDG